MKTYLAVLGRQPLISAAELESLCSDVKLIATRLATFRTDLEPKKLLNRLGGTLKIAEPINEPLPKFLQNLPPEGKITLGVSDFSKGTKSFVAQREAMKIKHILVKAGRSVRVVANKQTAELSSATSLHNRLFTEAKFELIKYGKNYYRVLVVQDIEEYVERDQVRPARDAKVGMLPPKLAQILINLCGNLQSGSRLLDPFCGTGVVLQEAALMGYVPYGTDLSERMVEYSGRNLKWLLTTNAKRFPKLEMEQIVVAQGDAQNYQWQPPVDAVACETYLGPPMSQAPVEIKMRQAKQECKAIITGFLKNLAEQIKPGTPVVIAVPAWLRADGSYERLKLLDEIEHLRYNVVRFKNLGQNDLLYHRDGQVVAREIIVLRKK